MHVIAEVRDLAAPSSAACESLVQSEIGDGERSERMRSGPSAGPTGAIARWEAWAAVNVDEYGRPLRQSNRGFTSKLFGWRGPKVGWHGLPRKNARLDAQPKMRIRCFREGSSISEDREPVRPDYASLAAEGPRRACRRRFTASTTVR